jgi:hypothetical protein
MSTHRSLAALAFAVAVSCQSAYAQEQFAVNTPIKKLHLSDLRGSKLSSGELEKKVQALSDEEPFKSGDVKYADADATIRRLVAKFEEETGRAAPASTSPAARAVPSRAAATQRVTFVHLLRWGQEDHSSVEFQRWYVYDPYDTGRSFDFTTDQARFEGTYVTGRTSFRLIYIHLNYDLLAQGESIGPDPNGTGFDVLKVPVSYKVAIQKEKTQLAKDFQTVLKVLGVTTGAASLDEDPVVGYFSVFTFDSAFQTSQVAITASLKQDKKPAAGAAPATTANDLANRTFRNERQAWLGLSSAIPLTSYEDIDYDQTGGVFTAKSIKRENVYFVADFYLPAVKPGLTRFRWLPHPFAGLPITGQPLRHTMAGLGLGLRWLEPFWAAVFNVQDTLDAHGKRTDRRTVIKGIWGIKVSVDAVAAALGKAGGGGSAAGAATKTDGKTDAKKESAKKS